MPGDQYLERDRLFQLVASLANLMDKAAIVETIKSVLGIEPVEMEDCILFDDISVRFGADRRVISICHTLDGTSERAKKIIRSLADDGCAN